MPMFTLIRLPAPSSKLGEGFHTQRFPRLGERLHEVLVMLDRIKFQKK